MIQLNANSLCSSLFFAKVHYYFCNVSERISMSFNLQITISSHDKPYFFLDTIPIFGTQFILTYSNKKLKFNVFDFLLYIESKDVD